MATKKSDEIQQDKPSTIVVLDSDGTVNNTDVFGIGDKIANIQGIIMQAAYKQLKGWLICGFATTGLLTKMPGRSDRDFVVSISFTIEFAPYTKAAIDRCVTVHKEALGKLPPDSL